MKTITSTGERDLGPGRRRPATLEVTRRLSEATRRLFGRTALGPALGPELSDIFPWGIPEFSRVSREELRVFDRQFEAARRILIERYGLHPGELRLLVTETFDESGNATPTNVINLTSIAPNGVDLDVSGKKERSYDSIMHDETHIVGVKGRGIDTRTGMTEELYREIVVCGKQEGLPEPDTNTMTWLTGVPQPDPDHAVVANTSFGNVSIQRIPRDSINKYLCYRPTVRWFYDGYHIVMDEGSLANG